MDVYTVVITFPTEIEDELKILRKNYNVHADTEITPHTTLKQPFFLKGTLDAVLHDLWEVAGITNQFSLEFDGLKYFEGENNVVYASFKEKEQVASLHAEIVNALKGMVEEKYKEERELDKFIPHATIGERIPDEEFIKVKQELSEYSLSKKFLVDSFELLKSTDETGWKLLEEYQLEG